ncbi:hypothetical protein [Acetobacterium sp.]|uniref:hypothetical protein n=1 Tax=Acetobacterium sp. TaxID=1872094 RepID=UPI002F41A2A1
MGTIVLILIFIGLMFVMSKFGVGCCGAHFGHNHHSSTKNIEGSGKEQISKHDFEEFFKL